MRSRLVLSFSIVVLLFTTSVFAQRQFGAIEGNLTEIEGLPIPGVAITVSSPSLIGGTALAYTDSGGYYRFAVLSSGTYEIKAELQGFQTVIRREIRLYVGGTVTVNFAMQAESISETITVLGAPPLIDSATTATSNTVPPEIVQNLPKPQGFYGMLSLLPLTPGVGSDLVAYGGAGEPANRIWVDGVDVSSPQAGYLYADYNYNWIEEVQVAGIGAPAEYGGFTGVVANFITRSGGNQFHGLFETFFQNQDFVSSSTPDAGPEPPFKSYDISAQLGGPILHDKLWFFTGFQYPYNQSHPFGYDGVTTEKYPKFFSKLTYKPNQSNTIQGFGHYNYYYLDGGSASPLVPPEATTIDECNESSWNATWISILNARTSFEGRFGGFWANCDSLPRNGDIPGYVDWDTGVATINAQSYAADQRFRPQVNASLTYFAQNFLGTHDFKFGVQSEFANASNQFGYNGNFAYYTFSYYGYQYLYRYSGLAVDDVNFDNQVNQTSVYAQDDWNLTDKFTLSLGLRWDHNRGVTDRGTVFATDPVAPRVGFVWTLRENRLTVLKAHYGMYYEPLLATQFYQLTDSALGFKGELFNSATGEWDLIAQQKFISPIVSDIKAPFVRQFTAGIDQELPGGIALGAHYIYKRWENILEDVDISTQYEPVPYVNPITGQTITVFKRLDPFADRVRVLTNPPGLFREYNGIEVIANRRFFGNLAITGSFVYSSINGNYPNDPDTVSPFSSFLNDPNDADPGNVIVNDPNRLINFSGVLINDPAMAWKVAGTYRFPWGFNTGWFFRHESGDTWTPTVLVRLEGQRPFRILGLPRGSNRLPATNILDLRVEKEFPIHTGQLRITADIFNVFNSAYVTEVNSSFESPDFGEPFGVTAPRSISLGLRYTF